MTTSTDASSRPDDPPDAVFAALADPMRRGILRSVAQRGPLTATSLAEGLPISRQAVAKHLGLLRRAGLVEADRAGRETRFVARTEPLGDLAAWAEATGRRWEDRLDRLRESVEGEGKPSPRRARTKRE